MEEPVLTYGDLHRAGLMLAGLEAVLRSEQAPGLRETLTGLEDTEGIFAPLAEEPPDFARLADDVAATGEVVLTANPAPLLDADRQAGDSIRDAFAILQAYASGPGGLARRVTRDALAGREPSQLVDGLAQVGLMGFSLLARRSGVPVTELLGTLGTDVAARLAEAGE